MAMPAYNQQHPIMPMPVASSMPAPKRIPHQRTAEEEAEDAARVARHRERQRKKGNFGRAVRYQVCASALSGSRCYHHSLASQPSALCCQPKQQFTTRLSMVVLAASFPSSSPHHSLPCHPLSASLQSRRAYAEIRPRIKGRFVSPEEYAQYQAQTAAQKAGLPYVPSMPAPAPVEDDAVVPMPSFVF
jgi:hypothetical protein